MTYSIYKPEDCEAQAYLQGLEPAVQLRENGGVVAGHVQHAEALQVQVAVQGLDEQLPGGAEGVEGPGMEGDIQIHDYIVLILRVTYHRKIHILKLV
jgi:hypothetical protein